MHFFGFVLAALIPILDVLAIVSVLGGTSPLGRKLLWVVVVILLPPLGMILYFLLGRSPRDAEI